MDKTKFKINILDQSPVLKGFSSSDAINQTIELAILADQLGYYRYWVAEHHSTSSFASASPEILIPVIASRTQNIRVGSGGVLISHYSPLKIAEQFNLLQNIISRENRFGYRQSARRGLGDYQGFTYFK